MNTFLHSRRTFSAVIALAVGGVGFINAAYADSPNSPSWRVAANHAQLVPGATVQFNSYNQPAVNERGVVVFRARSQGGSGQPATGIFMRDIAAAGPLLTLKSRRAVEE